MTCDYVHENIANTTAKCTINQFLIGGVKISKKPFNILKFTQSGVSEWQFYLVEQVLFQ